MIPPETPEEFRKAARDIGQEVARAVEQAGQLVRQALKDVGSVASPPPPRPAPVRPSSPPAATPGDSPVELIRRLGELRDAGYLTGEEFDAKKRELLDRVA